MDSSNIALLFVMDLAFLKTADEKRMMLKSLDHTHCTEASLEAITIDDIALAIRRDVHPREWNAADSVARVKKASYWIKTMGIGLVMDGEEGYPPLLSGLADRPFALFCRGDKECLTGRTVSVVGTRRVTPHGRQAAENFAHDAAKDGVSVVSGLAMGVDGAAHKGAVEVVYDAMERNEESKAGKSIAVLPCGVDVITPNIHKHLAENILSTGGCLVSEYLPGAGAEPWRFVQRNRIIAGMSPATLVVEAPPGSGALITAEFALDYGRDVVFHEAAFGKMAQSVASSVKAKLEAGHAQGKVSKSKLENTVQKYIDAGAPVVTSYQDYCKYMTEPPGMRAAMIDAGLFDNVSSSISSKTEE